MSKLKVLIEILVEITPLNDIYITTNGKIIESYDCTVASEYLFPITQNNFSFYENKQSELLLLMGVTCPHY